MSANKQQELLQNACGHAVRFFPRGKLAARMELALIKRTQRQAASTPISRPLVLHATGQPLRAAKVCLFAHFDPCDQVDPTVFSWLEALGREGYALVFITASRSLSLRDLQQLKRVCPFVLQRDNAGLDFASWKAAMLALPEVFAAGELLLANDSVYGPARPLAPVFAEMAAVPCDFWGLTASNERRPHLQSYFLLFRPGALRHEAFTRFWRDVEALADKNMIIRCYETGLSQRLALAGLRGAAYVPPDAPASPGAAACRNPHANPTLRHGLELVRRHALPALKRELLRENPERISLLGWETLFPSREMAEAVRAHLRRSGTPLPEAGEAPAVTALLPTRNGSRWLPDFLASCLATSGTRILARDDASEDATPSLLRQWRERYPERLEIHTGPRLGVMANVAWLLERVETPYFMLADQDDVWEDRKAPALLEAMQRLEAAHGGEKPLLVYSDAALVDAAGRETHPSCFAATGLPPRWSETLRHSLVMSNATGCTIMGNRALARAALPIPESAFMHDWWLLLVALALGAARAVNEPLVRYRQHGGNTLGADVWNSRTFWQKIHGGARRARRNIRRTQQQAKALTARYGATMPEERLNLCRAWADMAAHPWPRRVRTCLRLGFEKPGLMREGAFLLCV